MERSSKKSFSKKHINNNILFNINIVKQKNISKEKNTRLKKRKNSNKNDIYFQTNSKNLLYSKQIIMNKYLKLLIMNLKGKN